MSREARAEMELPRTCASAWQLHLDSRASPIDTLPNFNKMRGTLLTPRARSVSQLAAKIGMSQLHPSDTGIPMPASVVLPEADEVITPLLLGTLLLERYTIIELLSSDAVANVYRVAAMQRCAVCNVENDGGAEVCGFCGSALPPTLTRRVIEQRAPANLTHLPPTSFLLDGQTYTFARDVDTTAQRAPRSTRLRYGYQTDPGVQRGAAGEPNQDALAAFHLSAQHADAAPSLGLFILADGVGGAQAGHDASRLALQLIFNELNTKIIAPLWNEVTLDDEAVRDALRAAITKTNTHIIEWANENALQSGTTLTLALLIGQRAYIANLGDSRTYLARDGALEQITTDHSYIANLVLHGAVTPEEAFTHPQRNIILKSLGDATGNEPDLFPIESGALILADGDQLLLCSDGLWEMVREAEIVQVLSQAQNPQAACAQLVNLANRAGGSDNISVILIAIDSVQGT